MALAVAMNEWLTVMTSSPAPTPRTCSARCRAVVQLETAHACGAPTYAANSFSNAATCGPCVTHPDRMASRAAAASSSPSTGLAMAIDCRNDWLFIAPPPLPPPPAVRAARNRADAALRPAPPPPQTRAHDGRD